jgi:hypothetical protein
VGGSPCLLEPAQLWDSEHLVGGDSVDPNASVTGLARAIQLSVAPVFLLTGISGLLNIFTGRLSRIIDRVRVLQQAQDRVEPSQAASLEQALTVQRRRTFLINRAILCTGITALLVAAVVAVLFISAVAALDLAVIVVPVFVLAMAFLILGLVFFLLEVQLAIRQNPQRYY